MAESVTIEIFKEWGALESLRKTLLRQGAVLFGEPTDEVKVAVEGIDDLAYFDVLNVQLLKVTSWAELLATPRPAPPPKPTRDRRRRKS